MTEIVSPNVFALRLPRSTRRQAGEMAKQEGLSLNQFITLAVAEKLVRMESRRIGSTPQPTENTDPDASENFIAS